MNNTNHNNPLKRIAGALLLDRKQIRDICALGGISISANKADCWRRSLNAQRERQQSGETERRDKIMSDSEWIGFWRGLDIWLHQEPE